MKLAIVIGSPHRYPPFGRTGPCLMHEAHMRGNRVWCFQPEALREKDGRPVAQAHELSFPPTADLGTFWRRLQLKVLSRPPATLDLRGLDALIWRKDPPLDRRAALLLSPLAERAACLNDPRSLLAWGSKGRAVERFGHLMPPSVVAGSLEELLEAAEKLSGPLIVKPLEGHGGKGVVRLRPGERRALERRVASEPALARSLACGQGVLLQREVRGPAAGDLRILCLDGRVLGAMRRIPNVGEFRASVALGARVAPARLSAGAKSRWEAVAGELAAEGLYLVGLDVVGDRLLEANVVSPAGIPRMNALGGVRLEREVLDWLERRAGIRSKALKKLA